MSALLPALTSILAALFAVMLLDQWRERRHGFQLVWAFGMLCYALGAGAEAIAAANGWNEPLYRAWYLTGAIWTAGWLGLGTAFLLGRTRFGYTYAVLLLFGALLTFVIRNSPNYAGAGALPFLYLFGGIILSLAIGVETYFVNPRWTWFAGGAMIVVTVLSLVLVVLAPPLPAPGYSISAATGQPTGEAMPGYIRLLTPLPNITGGGALLLGALFSAYVFMPKKRVLAYSLDPGQKGDEFLFNLCIAVVAIPVNLVASLPGRRARAGRRPAALAGAGDAADRDRRLLPDAHRLAEPRRIDGPVPAGQVPGRAVPVRGLPRVGGGLPRGADPVHVDPPRDGEARAGAAARRGGSRGRHQRRAVQPPIPPARRRPAADARSGRPSPRRFTTAMLSAMDGSNDGVPAEAPVRIRVLLVDDHAVVRRGLHGFFELLDDIEVVGEAEDGRRAVELVAELQPDVVLMDLLMPVMDGIAATAEIKASWPDVEVVALTSFIEEERVTAALEAGATGYLLKDADADDVAIAVRRAQAGEVHLDPQVARLLANRIRTRRDGAPAAEPLTEREREVLALVAKGHSNKEIAALLDITERTARTHVSNILGKLDLASRTQAALWAIEHHVV